MSKVLYKQFLSHTGLKDSKKAIQLYEEYVHGDAPLAFYVGIMDNQEEVELTPKKKTKKDKLDKVAMIDTDGSSDKSIEEDDLIFI